MRCVSGRGGDVTFGWWVRAWDTSSFAVEWSVLWGVGAPFPQLSCCLCSVVGVVNGLSVWGVA